MPAHLESLADPARDRQAVANRRASGTITVADTDASLSFVREALGVKATRIGQLIVIRH